MTINGQKHGSGVLSKALSEVLQYDGLLNMLSLMKPSSGKKRIRVQEDKQNIINVQDVVESFLALKYK